MQKILCIGYCVYDNMNKIMISLIHTKLTLQILALVDIYIYIDMSK